MKLRFVVNWIGHFLKQLHANMAEQLFAVVENPTAPRARARAKSFLHPWYASAQKARLGLGSRSGFGAKSIA